jgi:hypothetical protein
VSPFSPLRRVSLSGFTTGRCEKIDLAEIARFLA